MFHCTCYGMIITNSALCARYGYLPSISNAHSWNNCYVLHGAFSHLIHLDQLWVSKSIWSIMQATWVVHKTNKIRHSLIKRLVITKEWVGLKISWTFKNSKRFIRWNKDKSIRELTTFSMPSTSRFRRPPPNLFWCWEIKSKRSLIISTS